MQGGDIYACCHAVIQAFTFIVLSAHLSDHLSEQSVGFDLQCCSAIQDMNNCWEKTITTHT